MDSASPAALTNMKAMNSLAAPANTGITNLTTSTPSWVCISKSKARINLHFRNQKGESFLLHCSTKANTERENATYDNLTIEPRSSSRIQEQAISGSNQTLSSSSSSFSRGLVFDLGCKDSWDSAEIGCPVVKRYLSDDEERWYMWYYGRSDGSPVVDSIGLAVSSNGIHWERGGGAARSASDVGLVMNPSSDWWAFDTQAIRPSEVVIMSSAKVRVNNSLYWLYYTGYNSENVESLNNSLKFNLENAERVRTGGSDSQESRAVDKIRKSLPGLAMSQDGRHWARIEGEHHSGALFDVGSESEWDSLFIASPQVVFHGVGDIRMYYHSFDDEKGHFAIGMARSRDGIKWLKLGKILGGGGHETFDEHGAMNARVVRDRKDGKYVMVYEGVGAEGSRSIGLAFSADGLKSWRRFEDGPVLKQSEAEGWDCEGVGSPCLVQMDGEEDEWRLYYRGIGKEDKTGIGMAVSEGSEFSKLQRWTGFRL